MRKHLTVALLLTMAASPAWAHAFLERASPPVGGKVTAAPRDIVLIFTEGVEPAFTTIRLRDAHGTAIPTGKPRTEPGDDRRLVIDLPSLPQGVYTVIWHATSVDTHKTEGSYQFTVGP